MFWKAEIIFLKTVKYGAAFGRESHVVPIYYRDHGQTVICRIIVGSYKTDSYIHR